MSKDTAPTETVLDPRVSQLTAADLVAALCRRVGLEPGDVGELRVTPSKLTATVFKRNGLGHKYLGDDGRPAVETWEVSLRP